MTASGDSSSAGGSRESNRVAFRQQRGSVWTRILMASGYVKLNVGDEVELRKPHACGTNAWRIVRKGVDIRIQCLGCGHQVLLAREKFLARLKRLTASPLGGGSEPSS